MRAMKGQVHLEWQMEVDRTGQERKYTERETHQETQKIKVRPGHTTPRAQHLTNATCRCGAQQTAADDRCLSAPRSDDCRGAILLPGARPNRASGESPPEAKSPGAS